MHEAEAIYQIRTHLLYELKWMIFAASRFAGGKAGDVYVALIDSAAVHARNLLEFGASRKRNHFTLNEIGGSPKKVDPWDRWTNNRVMHMTTRERDRAPWPDGLDNTRTDRLMVMAGAVLDRLESGGGAISPGPVRESYFAVLRSARQYWSEPTEQRHQALQALYDDSRDTRPY